MYDDGWLPWMIATLAAGRQAGLQRVFSRAIAAILLRQTHLQLCPPCVYQVQRWCIAVYVH